MKYRDMLKYRNLWLACAMLAVMWFHSKLLIPGSIPGFLKSISYLGADIMIFASGCGCWYSLEKEPRVQAFYRKRLLRLMPTYWLFMLFWLPSRLCFDPISPLAALGNILGIQYLTGMGGHFNWYISGILLFYLLAPALKYGLDRMRGPLAHVAALAALLLVSALFIGGETYLVIAVRLPLFFLGMLFSKLGHRRFGLLSALVAAAAAFLGFVLLYLLIRRYEDAFLWSKGLYWYPCLLIAPGFCVLSARAAAELEKLRPLRFLLRGLECLGKYSFEIYLVHFLLFDALFYLINRGLVPSTNLLWLAAMLLVLPLCLLLHRGGKKFEKLILK